MKKTVHAVLMAVLLSAAPAVVAADFTSGAIVVSDPWARASASPMMKTGAAFLVLTNRGTATDRLVAAESPVAEKVELHTHLMDGGVMKMRPVRAVEVDPGTPTVLQPGGLHVMFIGLRAPLAEGASIPLTLVFEKAGRIAVTARVLAPGAMGPSPHAPENPPHGMSRKPAG